MEAERSKRGGGARVYGVPESQFDRARPLAEE